MLDRRTWIRRATGRILTLAGVAGTSTSAFLVSAGIALAHANFEKVDPPAGSVETLPEQLVLTFSGALDRGSGARLPDMSGLPVDGASGGFDEADRARIVRTIPRVVPGLYTVAWVTRRVGRRWPRTTGVPRTGCRWRTPTVIRKRTGHQGNACGSGGSTLASDRCGRGNPMVGNDVWRDCGRRGTGDPFIRAFIDRH